MVNFKVKKALARDEAELKKIKDYISLILDDFVREVKYPIVFDYKINGVKYKKE